ncbi:MAG TPA: hypothetical protein VLB47_15380, partial [Solirubrobacteraceae bacterium]|nr:hypothetical protein [Solirubrobacteraceae bacterium]
NGEQVIYSLGNAIQAVGDGNYGRLGAQQQKRYTDANAESMFGEPFQGARHTAGTPDEQPGAMPEVLPSPGFDAAGDQDANMERCTRCRSMVMQAWGNYGTMWPVVHQQLGVRPDMGRGALEVVPQVPAHDDPIAGRDIRLGDGALALVRAARSGDRYTTVVDTGTAPVRRLRIGHTLGRGAWPLAVFLDGRRAGRQVRLTNRGAEVTVATGPGRHVLEVIATS